MLAKIHAFGLNGLDAYPVTIEIDITNGLPSTTIVGLPDSAIRESKERVRSAIKNSGYQYPPNRITINLSPADTKKEGPAFDLAIAIGLLAASEQISTHLINNTVLMGELSLDGHVRSIVGSLPIAIASQQQHIKTLVLPKNNIHEAHICKGIHLLAAISLSQTIHNLEHPQPMDMAPCIPSLSHHHDNNHLDFADVKGQRHVKRALEIAAAGNHNALMIGPPGSGKTMMAKRLPSILPDMTLEEALEVTKIHSIMGLIEPGTGLIQQRPFRAPHHTSSDIALIGGGSSPRPGEVTLAHHGVLFLDELPEFRRNALEVLRQPLEDHIVTIARASKTQRFPARFLFLASMNPSPSGYDAHKNISPYDVNKMHKYLQKISGPLLDRIDLHIEVPALKTQHLIDAPQSEQSSAIKKRTVAARHIQHQRFNNETIFSNAHMNAKHLKQYCVLDHHGKTLLRQAVEELGLSARAHDKILKVSRTIADLASSEVIKENHIAEAIQYRNLDRSWWQ